MFWFHICKWKAVAADSGTTTAQGYFLKGVYMPFDRPLSRPITMVLFRCECGAVKTETLDGHWTLEQITSPTNDKEFLKTAGVKTT